MGHHKHNHADASDDAAVIELLDLDAEVLQSYLAGVVAWVGESVVGRPRRIIDVGAGTGSGTFALLQRFDDADVLALDLSAASLARIHEKARERGVSRRALTIQADLDAEWPDTETVDLAWASMSLHHMADPDRVLRNVYSSLRPGGLLSLTESDSFPRFLPDDVGLGRPGLEVRCHEAVAGTLADELPHLGSEWGPRLAAAGFAVEAERQFDIDLEPPLPPVTGRYAQATLRRIRGGLDGLICADDLATLDTLVHDDVPQSVLRRDDLTVRATRTVWLARRPNDQGAVAGMAV